MSYQAQTFVPHGEVAHPTPIFAELLLPLEFAVLRLSPTYYGYQVPRGDGSAVVLIPGLVGWDFMLFELHNWLKRIGYRPYYSGVGFFGDCPNVLLKRIDGTIDRAFVETGRPVHLIGHSLGGILARSAAVQRPKRVASVITLGSPFRGFRAHSFVFMAGDVVRSRITRRRPDLSLDCGTSRCTCSLGRSLQRRWPKAVRQTTMFSTTDGLVDWRYCLTGKPDVDIEVSGTHLGLPFNAGAYRHIGDRLASVRCVPSLAILGASGKQRG